MAGEQLEVDSWDEIGDDEKEAWRQVAMVIGESA